MGAPDGRKQEMKDEEEECGRETLFSLLNAVMSPSRAMISQEWAETPVQSWLSLFNADWYVAAEREVKSGCTSAELHAVEQ